MDPDAICALLPGSTHSNKKCFIQINAKAAKKEKKDKEKSSAKPPAKANATKETESSDTN